MKPLFTALAIGFFSLCSAGNVPVEWTADVDSLAVHEFAARRGETLELAVKLTYHGKPFAPEGDWEIFYQTNGMGSAYFTFPVAVEGNVARVTFTPAMDPGSERLVGFIGRRGVNYRAAFALRFYGSPGASPNTLTLPAPAIDFAQIEVYNAPWATAADLGDKRGKTDLTVYGLVTNSYRLAKECLPVEGYIVQQDIWSELDITSWETQDFPSSDSHFKKILTAKKSDGSSYFALFVDENGLAIYEDGLMAYNMTYGGRKFTPGEWPILEPVTSILPTADTLATSSTVAQVARQVVNTVWDEKLGVAWEARMHNGQLYYVAVTNQPPEVK